VWSMDEESRATAVVEQAQAAASWNTTDAPYPDDMCIHTLFEAQVARTPAATALIHGDRQVSFDALNREANRLARYLRRLGVGPASLVGLYMDRSPDAIVALLAILKAGGAYVPLDPAYPDERIAFMMEDAAPVALLTHESLTARLPARAGHVVVVDGGDRAGIEREDDDDPPATTTAGEVAYVIYTSGSTGRPKGVVAPHRAAINRFHWMWQTYPFEEGEVCCQKTALSFVDSVWEVFGPLLRGVPIVIIPDTALTDTPRFVEALATAGVTRLVLVPSLLRLILHAAPDLRERAPRLIFWVSSGEALPAGLCHRFRQQLPGCTLLNLYGSSEVAADATYYDTRAWDGATPVPIGRPIANMRVYLLDEGGQHVPQGEIGEIHVAGAGLARGYLNLPDLTAERFISDPFRPQGLGLLYKTGDLGRYRPDGTIEYHGRNDHQIKVRGRRIELGEIEAALAGHPAVREAVVVACDYDYGAGELDDRRIVAYMVPDHPRALSGTTLRGYLRERLPTYMVPSTFVPLDALPLTPNGKVDRGALPVPDTVALSAGPVVAPTSVVEERLVGLWEELLGIRPIGIRDNFFELGAHSLLAVRLIDEIERLFGSRLSLATLFEEPTVAHLATALHGAGEAEQDDAGATRLTGLVTVQPIRDDSARRPLYFVHGDFWGGGFYTLNLSRHLGSDQPFYAFEQHGLHDERVPDTIEAMAAHHVRTLRAHQPDGPYLLGGHCSAGLIAFEMARQLKGQGQRVDLLALVHTAVESRQYALARRVVEPLGALVGLDSRTRTKVAESLGGRLRRLDRLGRMSPGERLTAVREKMRRVIARDRVAAVERSRGLHVARDNSQGGLAEYAAREGLVRERQQKVNQAYIQANRRYIPGQYPGPVALFVARDEREDYRRDKTMGWRRAIGAALDIQPIPGDHVTCVTDDANVRVVAGALRARIDRAQPKPTSPPKIE